MSLWKSIINAIPPVHPAGYPFIAIGLIITLILGLLGVDVLAWVGLIITGWVVIFFRDPERVTPAREGLVVSPADGRISDILDVTPPFELNLGSEPMTRISVFMNVFDCHVNRAPIAGFIENIHYTPGKFFNAELDKASEYNERNSLTLNVDGTRIGVVQIAGLIARRIICFSHVGDNLHAGERFGLIRFGSRLDVYVPKGTVVLAGIGQRAVAGETPIADLKAKKQDGRTFNKS